MIRGGWVGGWGERTWSQTPWQLVRGGLPRKKSDLQLVPS